MIIQETACFYHCESSYMSGKYVYFVCKILNVAHCSLHSLHKECQKKANNHSVFTTILQFFTTMSLYVFYSMFAIHLMPFPSLFFPLNNLIFLPFNQLTPNHKQYLQFCVESTFVKTQPCDLATLPKVSQHLCTFGCYAQSGSAEACLTDLC